MALNTVPDPSGSTHSVAVMESGAGMIVKPGWVWDVPPLNATWNRAVPLPPQASGEHPAPLAEKVHSASPTAPDGTLIGTAGASYGCGNPEHAPMPCREVRQKDPVTLGVTHASPGPTV